MFPSLLLLICLFVTVGYNHGQILPPRNVSLRRINDFELMLSWQPPENSVGCEYKVITKSEELIISQNSTTLERIMEGGFLNVSLKSFCNKSESEPVVLSETNPDLVTGFQCYVHSLTQTNCSWSPASVTADLHMFYWYVTEGTDIPPSELEECSSYIYTEGMKTGCSLPLTSKHSINVLFNATLNNKTVRNVFYRNLLYFVRLPALKWRAEKWMDGFNISWDPPEVLQQWTFIINYTMCRSTKSIRKSGVTSLRLLRDPGCQCSLAIKAENEEIAETPWSDTKYFDADPNPLLYLVIIIPLVIASLTVLGVMCYQKNKAIIFPKIPEPRDLLSDICDNNNKITLCNFHVPTVEEDCCKIALVIDPQVSKLDS